MDEAVPPGRSDEKAIVLSRHAAARAKERGATQSEVVECIRTGQFAALESSRFQARCAVRFDAVSPVNGKFYRWKTVEVIFVEEETERVVVTVKVYYSNEEDQP